MKRGGRWLRTKYIVSDNPAFVYFVVPKVACSAVKTALLPLFPDVPQASEFGDEAETGAFAYRVHKLFDHSGHQVDKAGLLELLRNGCRDDLGFAFVRNPWDRLLSCWRQKVAPDGQGFAREDYGGETFRIGMGFPDFVEAVSRVPDEEAEPHFRSQHVVVCGNGRQKRVLPDFVGRFENLADDFASVAARIGADPNLPRLLASGPSRDRSDARAYRDAYDANTARLVGERYRLDAEIFGYSF